MSDNVARQKSARWVTEVPNYGDWGDEDYDVYDDNSSTENVPVTNSQSNQGGWNQRDVVHEEEAIVDEHTHVRSDNLDEKVNRGENAQTKASSPLVLSIDKLENTADTDSSDEEERAEDQDVYKPTVHGDSTKNEEE